MIKIERQVTDPLGFHVQLAVLLAGEAQRWRSHVTFRHGQASVDAADLMALLGLGVPSGSTIEIDVEGPDEATAAEASVTSPGRSRPFSPAKTRRSAKG